MQATQGSILELRSLFSSTAFLMSSAPYAAVLLMIQVVSPVLMARLIDSIKSNQIWLSKVDNTMLLETLISRGRYQKMAISVYFGCRSRFSEQANSEIGIHCNRAGINQNHWPFHGDVATLFQDKSENKTLDKIVDRQNRKTISFRPWIGKWKGICYT